MTSINAPHPHPTPTMSNCNPTKGNVFPFDARRPAAAAPLSLAKASIIHMTITLQKHNNTHFDLMPISP